MSIADRILEKCEKVNKPIERISDLNRGDVFEFLNRKVKSVNRDPGVEQAISDLRPYLTGETEVDKKTDARKAVEEITRELSDCQLSCVAKELGIKSWDPKKIKNRITSAILKVKSTTSH